MPTRLGPGVGDARRDLAGLAAALLEAADPGLADGVLGGDGAGGQALIAVGEDPLADAERFRRTEQGVCLITQPMIDRLR